MQLAEIEFLKWKRKRIQWLRRALMFCSWIDKLSIIKSMMLSRCHRNKIFACFYRFRVIGPLIMRKRIRLNIWFMILFFDALFLEVKWIEINKMWLICYLWIKIFRTFLRHNTWIFQVFSISLLPPACISKKLICIRLCIDSILSSVIIFLGKNILRTFGIKLV